MASRATAFKDRKLLKDITDEVEKLGAQPKAARKFRGEPGPFLKDHGSIRMDRALEQIRIKGIHLLAWGHTPVGGGHWNRYVLEVEGKLPRPVHRFVEGHLVQAESDTGKDMVHPDGHRLWHFTEFKMSETDRIVSFKVCMKLPHSGIRRIKKISGLLTFAVDPRHFPEKVRKVDVPFSISDVPILANIIPDPAEPD
jgi:hypothetical protein